MKERPILFSAPMVRAILDDRKTVTRRVVRLTAPDCIEERAYGVDDAAAFGRHLWPWSPQYDDWIACPYGAPGDRLWVKETWHPCARIGLDVEVEYRADESSETRRWNGEGNLDAMIARDAWRPCIFMPRWASRITLNVTSISVERLHDITEKDAKAEGVECVNGHPVRGAVFGAGPSYREGFAQIWHDTHGAESWDANPWVWRVGFRRTEAPRD